MALLVNINADIDSSLTDKEVEMFPLPAIFLNPSMTFQSYHIVFLSLSSLFRWLDILHDDHACTYLFRVKQKNRNTGYARMLGGVQWHFIRSSYAPFICSPDFAIKGTLVHSMNTSHGLRKWRAPRWVTSITCSSIH